MELITSREERAAAYGKLLQRQIHQVTPEVIAQANTEVHKLQGAAFRRLKGTNPALRGLVGGRLESSSPTDCLYNDAQGKTYFGVFTFVVQQGDRSQLYRGHTVHLCIDDRNWYGMGREGELVSLDEVVEAAIREIQGRQASRPSI